MSEVDSSGKVIAVTGAAGLVGGLAADAFRALGHEVRSIDRGDPHDVGGILEVDLTDHAATVRALDGADVVVHIAGINNPVLEPGWHVHNNNVTSSYNVLSAAAELGIPRVVQSSSVNAVGLAWSRHPEFDYFPIDLAHRSRVEDPYSLSKRAQELQAESLVNRYDGLSVVSLRLHAVLSDRAEAQKFIEQQGESWAVNGLWGWCRYDSVASAITQAAFVPIDGHEILFVTEAESFDDVSSAELAQRFYPKVDIRPGLDGNASFFDIHRTREVLHWTPATDTTTPAIRQTKEH